MKNTRDAAYRVRMDFGFLDVPDKMYPISEHHPRKITLGLEHKESDKEYVPFIKFHGRLYKKTFRTIVPGELRNKLCSAMEYRRTGSLPAGIKMDSIYVFIVSDSCFSSAS